MTGPEAISQNILPDVPLTAVAIIILGKSFPLLPLPIKTSLAILDLWNVLGHIGIVPTELNLTMSWYYWVQKVDNNYTYYLFHFEIV